MKKLFVLILALVLCCSSAYASSIDLSGMTFDELVALREQLNLAIWNSQEWQEVTVPAGVWKVGEDIPAGSWTIVPVSSSVSVYYCDRLDEYGVKMAYDANGKDWIINADKKQDGSWKYSYYPHQLDLDLADNMYLILSGTVVFTPYTGKPDLGFK